MKFLLVRVIGILVYFKTQTLISVFFSFLSFLADTLIHSNSGPVATSFFFAFHCLSEMKIGRLLLPNNPPQPGVAPFTECQCRKIF